MVGNTVVSGGMFFSIVYYRKNVGQKAYTNKFLHISSLDYRCSGFKILWDYIMKKSQVGGFEIN